MAFSDYKNIAQVQKEFGVRYEETNFVPAAELEPSAGFQSEFAFTLENFDVFTSEAARTEAIIFPILRELYKSYHDYFSLWIQAPLAYNDKLKGTPDYLLATKSPLGKTVLETPLVAIVEAKKNDFEQGWGQCLAELVAAQKLNQDEMVVVYGIVTDGKLWEFGKLVQTTFSKNGESFTVDHLARLFGVLNFIFQAAASGAPASCRP
jgi:hypothetical protein